MRVRSFAALICCAVALGACEAPEGSFRVVFEWEDGPPSDPEALFVYGVVQHAPHRGDPQTLASVGPESYGRGLELGFSDVPIGADRQVVVELRTEPGKDAQVAYYGISERFAMQAGEDVVVPVRIALVHTPGFGEGADDVGIAIQDLATIDGSEPGYATSPEVTLRVVSDSAVAVELSNLPELPTPEVIELSSDDEVESEDGAPGLIAYELAWDLDEGLPEPCGAVDFCTRRVFARFIDAEGYRSPIYDAQVIIDSKPAGLEPGTSGLSLEPSADNPLVLEGLGRRLSRVRSGTTARLTFALDEVVPEDPIVIASSDGRELSFERRGGNGVAFIYELEYQDDAAIGEERFALRIEAVDKAGTESTIELEEELVVDTQAPAAASEPEDDTQTLVYERAPWGNAAAGQPYFALRGAPESVEPGSTLLVLDGADPATAQRIGRAFADDEGGFEAVPLTLADRAEVYTLVVDDAGNTRERATLVRDVEWTAGFGENALGNPHRFDSRSWFLGTLEQADAHVDSTAVAAAGEDDGWARAQGGGRFQRGAAIDAPDPRIFTRAVFDRARGQVVSIGGRRSLSTLSCDGSGSARCDGVLEWNGHSFARKSFDGPAPSPRDAVGLSWHESRGYTLLFGGKSAVGAMYCGETTAGCGDTWAYDGESFRLLHPGGDGAPKRRHSHSLVYDRQRDRSVLFGGILDSSVIEGCGIDGVCGDTWEWNGDAWAEITPDQGEETLPARRSDHAAAYDEAHGVTVIFGGFIPRFPQDVTAPPNNETWTWDGEVWTLVTPPEGAPEQPSARAYAAMAYSSALGRVVMFGGQTELGGNCDGNGTVFCDVMWSWNGELWERVEQPAPALPTPVGRSLGSMVEDQFGQLVLFGGKRVPAQAAGDCAVAGTGECSGIWVFDGRHWRERTGALADASAPAPRFDHAMAYDPATGGTLLFGGQSAQLTECLTEDGQVPPLPPAYTEAWLWNGNGWSARALAEGQTVRRGSSLAWSEDEAGLLLLAGELESCDGGASPLCEAAWTFDGTFAASAVTLAGTPQARRDASLIALGDGSSLLVGGLRERAALGDAWVLDAGAWSAASAGDAPTARFGAALGYDPERDQTVLFGGATITDDRDNTVTCSSCRCPMADTFVWSDGAWTELSPDHAPPSRVDGQLAYASAREALVLYAGNSAGDCGSGDARCQDVWEWHGDDWYQVEPADPEGDGNPSLRSAHAMVADEARGELLVFGGVADAAQSTWIWHPGADARPAQVARFDFSTTGAASDAELRTAHLTWKTQAESTAGDEATLLVWSQGRFEPAADLGFAADGDRFEAGDPVKLSVLPYGARRELSFAMIPDAANGTHPGYASIASDFAALTVEYRLPAP